MGRCGARVRMPTPLPPRAPQGSRVQSAVLPSLAALPTATPGGKPAPGGGVLKLLATGDVTDESPPCSPAVPGGSGGGTGGGTGSGGGGGVGGSSASTNFSATLAMRDLEARLEIIRPEDLRVVKLLGTGG